MPALALEAIQGMSGRLLWLGLLHSLWLGLVTAALVALVFQVRWTLTHRSRHAILLTALCLVAAGPPTLTAVQYCGDWRQSWYTQSRAKTAVAVRTESSEARVPTPAVARAIPSREETASLASLVRSLNVALDGIARITRMVRPFALAVWSLIVLSLTVVLALGVRGLNRLRRDASPAPEPVQKRARRLGRLLRLRNIPAIRVHATVGEPFLGGVLQPTIVLPGRWLATASPESLDAVLAHELAHARRYDHVVNLAQRILEALLFFHPGVHWLSRSLRRQREHGADALAVRMTGNPLALARTLETLARSRLGPLMAACSVGAALNGESPSLLPRIQELIGMMPTRPRTQVWPFTALASAMAFALVAVSTGFTQDEPSPKQQSSPAPVKASQAASPGRYGPPTPSNFDRQLSFEVRTITCTEKLWHEHLNRQLAPCGSGPGTRGWIIDHRSLFDLLMHTQGDALSNVLQAPKVTTFEGARATILWGSSGFGVEWDSDAIKDLLPTPRDVPPTSRDVRPLAASEAPRELPGGLRLDLKGEFLPRGARLSVDLRDPMTTAAGKDRKIDLKPDTSQKHPAGEVRYQGSCDVSTGSTLLISLGQYQHQVGLRSVALERLVVVTPRCITLEPESPVAFGVNDNAASRPDLAKPQGRSNPGRDPR